MMAYGLPSYVSANHGICVKARQMSAGHRIWQRESSDMSVWVMGYVCLHRLDSLVISANHTVSFALICLLDVIF